MLLLLAAVIWGSGFVAQRRGMEHVGPMTFNSVRFALGFCVLLPAIWIRRTTRNKTAQGGQNPRLRLYVLGGCAAGSVLFVAAALQQIGLIYTTAGKAGFITGLYVVFVPILGLFLRRSVARTTWLAVGLAVVGLYLLSVTGSFEVNRGDWFICVCALFWAVHVLVIGHLAPRTEPLRLAAVQFAICSLLSLVAALLTEEISLNRTLAARWAILYSGVFSVGMAFSLQVIAQREAPPTHAAILLSLEAVFAAVAGGLILGETLDERQMVGCVLLLTGGLVSQMRRTTQLLPVP